METRDRHGSLPPLIHGARLKIVYRSGRGKITGRSIRIISVSGGAGGPIYIRAFCELKREERTFRADRIIVWSIPEDTQKETDDPPYDAERVESPPGPGPPSEGIRQAAHRRKKKKRKWPAVLAAGLIVWGMVRFHDELPGPFREKDQVSGGTVRITSTDGEADPEEAAGSLPEKQPAVPAETGGAAGGGPGTELYEERLAERARLFIETAGIGSPELLMIYAAADTDRDEGLSWGELEEFQELAAGTFTYAANSRALRPDEFLAAGGGDCEDFALFTAGLVRFWGGLPYIGVIRGGDRTAGHAVCLVYSREEPVYHFYWTNDGSAVYPGLDLPAGYFVPVDYEFVGGLSNAAAKGWSLAEIMIPEEIYGLPL